jgi:hypothetical protein
VLADPQHVDFQDFVFQLVDFKLLGFHLEAESAGLSWQMVRAISHVRGKCQC